MSMFTTAPPAGPDVLRRVVEHIGANLLGASAPLRSPGSPG